MVDQVKFRIHRMSFRVFKTRCRRCRPAAAARRRPALGGDARGRPPRCRLPARAPAAAAPRQPSSCAHRVGQPVQQRHGQRAPFDHRDLVADQQAAASQGRHRAARCTPRSSSRPPLRYSGRPVSCVQAGDRDAGPLERLEQRIGQPLRQLVERHQPPSLVAARPDAASSRRGDAVDASAAPARSARAIEQRRRGSRAGLDVGRRRRARRGCRTDCPSRAGRSPNISGCSRHRLARAGAAGRRGPRARPADLSGPTWNAARERRRVEARASAAASARSGCAASAREQRRREQLAGSPRARPSERAEPHAAGRVA